MVTPFFKSIPNAIVTRLGAPDKLNYPFNYVPHPLARYAAEALQNALRQQRNNEEGEGKMFGVLVVKNKEGQYGYLQAFSGKWLGKNLHPGFVPPIFDALTTNGFFLKGEAALDQLNDNIRQLEQRPEYLAAKQELLDIKTSAEKELQQYRSELKKSKAQRKQKRLAAETLNAEQLSVINDNLDQESLQEKNDYRRIKKGWAKKIDQASKKVSDLEEVILVLKAQRKSQSATLQEKLFDQYNFLNQRGEIKNVRAIFQRSLGGVPPAAAGDCAAPKLFQYAFQHQLEPICMAEFWWGPPSPTQVRKHGQYYPACRGKCEPILSHMLQGLAVDENPLLANPASGKALPVIYEDDYLLAVNKPTGFLSVPGKNITDSVYERMRLRYPGASGPLIVHRLDMSTSGVLLVAKEKAVHQALQAQFIKRRVKKRYVALLEGELKETTGQIDLPLRVDLDNRPQQMVCYTHGKKAKTKWEVVEIAREKTRIHFFPLTGRTHQLRVHAAHPKGLNAPIIGDELYGMPANHLHLHAESITFWHPVKKVEMTLRVAAPF